MSKEQDLLGSPGNDFNSQEFVVVSPGAYYNRNGLTVTSNNNAIIPRDSLVNIIIQENNINKTISSYLSGEVSGIELVEGGTMIEGHTE